MAKKKHEVGETVTVEIKGEKRDCVIDEVRGDGLLKVSTSDKDHPIQRRGMLVPA